MCPLYDLHCSNCDYVKVDEFYKINEKLPKCPKCGKQLSKTCNCTTFKLKYDNKKDICDWNGNTSRYWDIYNKEKAEGKNVRIPSLDGD
jgi:hypothetical protein